MEIKQKVMEVKIVKLSELQPNSYNPNKMTGAVPLKVGSGVVSDSGSMMALLKSCILKYGFLFPIIVSWDEDLKKYRIIDGYHRYEALKQLGADEVAILDMRIPYHDAVQLTVLMNRIKGFHQIELMSDLVVKLEDLGLTDSEICENLGMESEEHLRLKQQLGIAHAFRNHEYSKSWEEEKKRNKKS
jgi:ParB-like chromosome segregation protein Spo0J